MGKGSQLGKWVKSRNDSPPEESRRVERIAAGSVEDALIVQRGRKEQILDKMIGRPRQPHCLLVGKLEDFRGKVL